MKKLVCNYAVARFLPYTETEEFVCVGVVLFCPDTRYFGFRLETKKRDRVTRFFPELDPAIYTKGRRHFELQLQHAHRLLMGGDEPPQMKLDLNPLNPVHIFTELVRPRESLFRFGGISTLLADDPAVELDRLFMDYVHRQFAQRDEYQETIMVRRLQNDLRQAQVVGYKPLHLGDDMYRFTMPFVRGDEARYADLKAIKPLHLAQDDTTKIIDHGELWCRRIDRLLNLNVTPDRIMLPVKVPDAGDKRGDAAKHVVHNIQKLGILIVPFGSRDEVVEFARVA